MNRYRNFVHICYADDSGRAGVVTFTGLLVRADGWNCLMHCWLEGRRKLATEPSWRVDKHAELHANQLTKKGAGRFCEAGCQEPACSGCTEADSPDCCGAPCCASRCCRRGYFENKFSTQVARDSAYRIMMTQLARCEALTVTTLACRTRNTAVAYDRFVNHLDQWAIETETSVLVFLDGPQGPLDVSEMAPEAAQQERAMAGRNAAPYRRTHRELELGPRRVIEDPQMMDSKYSQLIQAADLVAYGAYQYLWSAGTWPSGDKHGKPKDTVVSAYRRLEQRWLPGSDHGITWTGGA
ncbi:DUF3800 domain-containing protein [Actinoplanes sp. NPDC024001]|uniref:DUF3800 domain-containing protein n=1 Tax=Actinoplanes sp. NPDC024001 TaxID=3154598 RepID=UPI0033CF5FCE